jgi:hypothetical protein
MSNRDWRERTGPGGLRGWLAQAMAAVTLLLAVGAHAATISGFNSTPVSVGTPRTNLLGRPIKVAVNTTGGLYVLTERGWIFSLSGTFGDLTNVRLPGMTTNLAVAVATNGTGDVYAARGDGTVFHFNTGLTLLHTATLAISGVVRDLVADGVGNVYVVTSGGEIFKRNSILNPLANVSGLGTLVTIEAETSTGNLYVATSTGTVRRLNNSLATQATGTVTGTPLDIASDNAGNVLVATSTGLHRISPSIAVLASFAQTSLVGVDMDDAGTAITASATGTSNTLFVLNSSLSGATRSVSTGINPTRAIAINLTGNLYAVGGTDGASEGDPHLTTINGVRYDFQSAGEFVLLRHNGSSEGPVCGPNVGALEIQVRQFPVATTASTCVSLNGAVAAKVGNYRVTYQPNLSGQPDPSGLQLRLNGQLVALPPGGLVLGDAGRIVPTTATGGLEIEFADDSALTVTPGYWESQGKWYMNVNVTPSRRVCGLIGTVPEGSWLPTLPDGTSMGPEPPKPEERYTALYRRFADAWRVTKETSLFDYAPGTSTDTFTDRSWPPEEGGCTLPGVTPVEGASEAVAKQACQGVVGDPANCVFDVMVTGHTGIAQTYVASRTAQPLPPATPTPPTPPVPHPPGKGPWWILAILVLLALAIAVFLVIRSRQAPP